MEEHAFFNQFYHFANENVLLIFFSLLINKSSRYKTEFNHKDVSRQSDFSEIFSLTERTFLLHILQGAQTAMMAESRTSNPSKTLPQYIAALAGKN